MNGSSNQKVTEEITFENWKYPMDLFPALVWYWGRLEFAKDGTTNISDTTCAEIAIDFQHVTHENLDRCEASEATLERRARYFAAASAQMVKVCRTQLLGSSYKRRSGA